MTRAPPPAFPRNPRGRLGFPGPTQGEGWDPRRNSRMPPQLEKNHARFPCPWDSQGKNTGVGCHFLLQCMKVKSESEVTQSCLTLSNPMDYSLPGCSVHGIFQARVLEWVAIAFSGSVTQLCPTLCHPMDCSMPGIPVLHCLLKLAETHVH